MDENYIRMSQEAYQRHEEEEFAEARSKQEGLYGIAKSASYDGKRQLVLNKDNGHQYRFICKIGEEDKLLDAFIDNANNEESDFDWFDAAVLSFKLSQRLKEGS